MSTPTSPLWKRNVSLLVAGQTVTMFGSALVGFAVMWHLTLSTGSGVILTLSIVASMVPQAITSVFGGVWADRYNRKALIIGADAARAVVTLVLALIMVLGVRNLPLIFVAMALRSALAGIQTPAAGAILPQITPPTQLLRVNGIRETLGALDAVIAPGIAAVLYATGSLELVFAIDVVSTVVGIVLLAFIPVTKAVTTAVAAKGGYFGELVAGVRYVVKDRSIRWVTLLVAGSLLFLGAPAILTTLMIQRTFGGETWMLAANEVAWFAGMMAAGGLIAVLSRRLGSTVRLLVVATVAAAFSTAALGLAGGHIALFLGLGVINGATFAFFMTPSTTFYQETVEPAMVGRVFGVVGVVTSLSMPISMVVFGPLADVIPVETVFLLGGAGLLALLGLFAAIPAARRSIAKAAAQPTPAPGDSAVDVTQTADADVPQRELVGASA